MHAEKSILARLQARARLLLLNEWLRKPWALKGHYAAQKSQLMGVPVAWRRQDHSKGRSSSRETAREIEKAEEEGEEAEDRPIEPLIYSGRISQRKEKRERGRLLSRAVKRPYPCGTRTANPFTETASPRRDCV